MIEALRRIPPERLALVDTTTSEEISYATLLARVDQAAAALRATWCGRGCAFLAMDQHAGAVVLYLAALAAGVPLALVEARPAALARPCAAYAPPLLLLPVAMPAPEGWDRAGAPLAGHSPWTRSVSADAAIPHPDLALLLATSGSTGSPKLVRLSRRNLEANARSILEYLGIGSDERAIASLPLHYSYGLSVLNSHLLAGASVVLTSHSFLRPEFWALVDAWKCTSFAGVPFMYESLHRLRFAPAKHPSIRTYTQAGGALSADLVRHFDRVTRDASARMVVMYGQTEATARISWVPPASLPGKAGTIGVAIPGGTLRLESVEGLPAEREIVYEGPNVMLGYAESPADLALGDVLHGVLRTGDLGRVDADGFHTVTGRLKRFAKLFGRRVSLEDVERDLETRFRHECAVFDAGDRLRIMLAASASEAEPVRAYLAHALAVPPVAITVELRPALERTASGKKDYRAIEAPR